MNGSRIATDAIPLRNLRKDVEVERQAQFVFAASVPQISAIIPTLNEADRIAAAVSALQGADVSEILVIDAQSNDDTARVAEELGCLTFQSPNRSRARQLNIGADKSSGEVLLFLHADTIVSKASIDRLRSVMDSHPEILGGGFTRLFDSPSVFLKVTCFFAAIRSKMFGLFLGDQAMFVRKEQFMKLGGFDESLAKGEDLNFSARLRTSGKTTTLSPAVLSSARRFEKHGPLIQTWKDSCAATRILRDGRRSK